MAISHLQSQLIIDVAPREPCCEAICVFPERQNDGVTHDEYRSVLPSERILGDWYRALLLTLARLRTTDMGDCSGLPLAGVRPALKVSSYAVVGLIVQHVWSVFEIIALDNCHCCIPGGH